MDTGEKFDRSTVISKITEMSEDDVVKVMIFMSGLEAGVKACTKTEAPTSHDNNA